MQKSVCKKVGREICCSMGVYVFLYKGLRSLVGIELLCCARHNSSIINCIFYVLT